ncbi:hypothetical protein BHE90_006211 [Fusarium euwallaceae]|uniref:Uncharacterized protein n=4 Tax=Fusarium solani species complex TaxID=232080 RepID=A0A3M2SK74_9HYPO|nr:hypothetical protein CDV36_002389 [Fusarium kuroshium]RSL87424.1 hypothetical protein CEP51_002244 [Fusarium floridanum]RSM12858.1 hypothetical protein CEP52_002276 [Fusarium oligoseptatum]RTE79303.1 hypothetical protein BHE90_006211 [Fusarium euwallaceae]
MIRHVKRARFRPLMRLMAARDSHSEGTVVLLAAPLMRLLREVLDAALISNQRRPVYRQFVIVCYKQSYKPGIQPQRQSASVFDTLFRTRESTL